MQKSIKRFFVMTLLSMFMVACAPPPPKQQDNVYQIFKEYPTWYWATQAVEKKYGVPESVQMAIIHQESSFNATIKTPRKKLLGFIPWSHQTTAYGYAQVLDATWNEYKNDTGRFRATRTDFNDAVNFIGWFAKTQAWPKAHIKPTDAYDLYLAYHEGINGYNNRSYLSKPALLEITRKVSLRAKLYHSQLLQYAQYLPKRPFWRWWV